MIFFQKFTDLKFKSNILQKYCIMLDDFVSTILGILIGLVVYRFIRKSKGNLFIFQSIKIFPGETFSERLSNFLSKYLLFKTFVYCFQYLSDV